MGIFGTSGLIKANLKTYFKARRKGLDVEEALSWVIQSRYPHSERNRQNVEQRFLSEKDDSKSEKQKITKLVLTILFNENPRLEDRCLFSQPSMGKDFSLKASLGQKIESQIDEIYYSMKKKYIWKN